MAMFFSKENKIWQEARLPSPVELFNDLFIIFVAILMTQWTNVLLDGGRRTDDAVVDEVVDIVMDAESIQVKGKTIYQAEGPQ